MGLNVALEPGGREGPKLQREPELRAVNDEGVPRSVAPESEPRRTRRISTAVASQTAAESPVLSTAVQSSFHLHVRLLLCRFTHPGITLRASCRRPPPASHPAHCPATAPTRSPASVLRPAESPAPTPTPVPASRGRCWR
jgi:hypothetical protein